MNVDRLEKIKNQMLPCPVCHRDRFLKAPWMDDDDLVWLVGEVERLSFEVKRLSYALTKMEGERVDKSVD